MVKKIIPLVLLFIVSVVTRAEAQKRMKTGSVSYQLVRVETKTPELKLMEGSELSVYFDGKQQKMDTELMDGLVRMQKIYMTGASNTTMLYDLMGQKYRVTVAKDDEPLAKQKIKYIKSQVKNIVGYPCHQAEITEGEDTYIIWVTSMIKFKNDEFEQLFPDLDGFPLEYTLKTDNADLIYAAQTISGDLPTETFQVPEAYQEISSEEFKEKMGGLDFGF